MTSTQVRPREPQLEMVLTDSYPVKLFTYADQKTWIDARINGLIKLVFRNDLHAITIISQKTKKTVFEHTLDNYTSYRKNTHLRHVLIHKDRKAWQIQFERTDHYELFWIGMMNIGTFTCGVDKKSNKFKKVFRRMIFKCKPKNPEKEEQTEIKEKLKNTKISEKQGKFSEKKDKTENSKVSREESSSEGFSFSRAVKTRFLRARSFRRTFFPRNQNEHSTNMRGGNVMGKSPRRRHQKSLREKEKSLLSQRLSLKERKAFFESKIRSLRNTHDQKIQKPAQKDDKSTEKRNEPQKQRKNTLQGKIKPERGQEVRENSQNREKIRQTAEKVINRQKTAETVRNSQQSRDVRHQERAGIGVSCREGENTAPFGEKLKGAIPSNSVLQFQVKIPVIVSRIKWSETATPELKRCAIVHPKSPSVSSWKEDLAERLNEISRYVRINSVSVQSEGSDFSV